MSVSDSDTGLEEILIDLKVISSLSQNNKLITGGPFLNIEKPYYGIPEWIRRMARGDGRDETIKRINSTINKAISMLDNDNEKTLSGHLSNSIKGLENLKRTYSSDTQTVARLHTVIEKIRTSLKERQTRPVIYHDDEGDNRSYRSNGSSAGRRRTFSTESQ